ncbi:MAG: N-acetylglucosamine-6-phosphate deacetylase [Ruminococcus sp.]
MIIRNGLVFQEDGRYRKQDLYIENRRIVSSRREVKDAEEINAEGLKIIPGLIDIHSHGAAGHDVSEGSTEGLKKILRYQKAHGVTSYCPTSMTLPFGKLLQVMESVNMVEESEDQAVIAGIHMEGPFLDPEKKGSHMEECIVPPDVSFFRECNEACGGKIRLVTLAPNMEGAWEFLDKLKDKTVISLGHTTADYETAKKAFEKGVFHVTHLYNAMAPFSHRAPGLVGAAFDSPKVMVELIGDGVHVHPSVVRSTFAMFGKDRVVLISDSIMAAGMRDGVYRLGGQRVTVRGQKAVLDDGTIAGSAVDLFTCVKRTIQAGVEEGDAILAATANPARSIGIFDRVGSITPGKKADLLLVDQELNLLQVIS